MLQVLTLFTASEPLLTAPDEIMQRLDYTRPTTYRYIREELCAAGLLGIVLRVGTPWGRVSSRLDYTIRQADPVLKVARGRMRCALADRYECEVVLLTIFGTKVVTVHEEKSKDSPLVSYGRGHPMPLFRGAGSKVLMAYLPASKQEKTLSEVSRGGRSHRTSGARIGRGFMPPCEKIRAGRQRRFHG